MSTSHISIDLDGYRYVTRPADPTDDWDRDDTAASLSVRGIHVVQKQGYRDLTVPFDVIPGRAYWLVWVDYDTGDSFGRDGNQFEAIDLFEDYELARACGKACEDLEEELNGKYVYDSLQYERQNGERVKVHAPWLGYFENLNRVEVQHVICLGAK